MVPVARSRNTSAQLVHLVRRFSERVPEVAEAVVDEIWEIPGYAASDEEHLRDEVTQAVERNVRAFLKALAEGRDLPKREIDELAIVGEERAHQGVPLEDVLRAFRTVGRVLWDHLSQQLSAEDRSSVDLAIELSGNLMRFTDEIASSVAHHYSIAQRSIVRRQEAARREFLHDLLQGTYVSPDDMVMRAREFGLDLARQHLGVVALSEDLPDPGEEQLVLSRALDRLAEELQSTGRPMVDRRGGRNIGLVGLSHGADASLVEIATFLAEELPKGWSVGVGGPYSGLEGCRRAFVEADEALQIGAAIDPERGAYVFEHYLLYRFLRADSALVERFVDQVLGPVIGHDDRRRSELVKTLDAYFAADSSAKEAGRRLYAHPHTVTYRLKQVERLTGRSLKDPEDKLHLHLAVKALRLTKQAPEESQDLEAAEG